MRAAWPQVGRGHTGGRTSEKPIQAKFREFLSVLKNAVRIEVCAGGVPQASVA